MKIEELGLSVRPYNVLKRARIDTVEQLQQLSDDDLMRFRNMGRHSLEEIREKVAYVKTMTNADWIRAMSDRELMEFVGFTSLCKRINREEDGWCEMQGSCSDCIEKWLREPAKEETHGS